MLSRFLALTSLAAALPLIAQEPNAGMQPMPEFAARVGGYWLAHSCPATGTPDRIYGTGVPLAGWREDTIAEARRFANAALVSHADLLKIAPADFREVIGGRMGNCWSFTYQQYHGDLPVLGGRADVRINGKGVLASIGSIAFEVPAVLTPTIGEETAVLQAWMAMGLRPNGVPQPRQDRRPRLVLWGDADAKSRVTAVLAWEIPISNVDAEGDGCIGRCYIDAATGNRLTWCSDKHDCAAHPHHAMAGHVASEHAITPTTITVMAWTRVAESGVAPPVNTPLANFTFNVPGIGNVTTDAAGTVSVNIAAPVAITITGLDGLHSQAVHPLLAAPVVVNVTPGTPATIQLFAANSTDAELAQSNAYYWTDRVNLWARSILGNTPELNAIDSVVPTVNLASACNAFYVGNTINFYAAGVFGSACNNTGFSTVIAHEWGHDLDDHYGGISNGATDGLSEGWGDIVAMYLLDTSHVALDFFTTPGSVLRSGINNILYGTQAEPHAAGQSWMGFAWLVRENLRTLFGTPTAIQISNQIVIGSIVANARNQIEAVTDVFLADDDDGNLLDGVPHYAALSGAAISKGLPFPQQQIAVLTHTPLGNTTDQFGARGVKASSFAVSSGSMTQVLLTYTLNAGAPVTQAMVHDGSANGYLGLIPGIQSGQITYHIEATHSSGYVVRSPAVGDHTYAVNLPAAGPFVGFYLEDFEGGGTGWTHGTINATGTDDWQIGRVAGFQGVTQGIIWSDPLFPASGQRAAGNSISGGGGGGGGGGGTSGAYAASSINFLRSPVIDCTGRTGVHLHFKRWLTVQDGSFDLATVLVNGVPVWNNPAGFHLVDTNWLLQEFVLPMADNNPSVQIEWRLTTDATIQFGGWAIDDVELGTRAQPAPPPKLLLLPELIPPHGIVTATVTHTPNTPFYLLVTDNLGPTVLPGVMTIGLGGNLLVQLFSFTDTSGHWQISLPTNPLPFGFLGHSQLLTLDANGNPETSNLCANILLP